LAAIYSNLLVNKQSMDFFFKPDPGAWPDKKLRVAPDLLPSGSVELAEVWIDGKSYLDFDRKNLVVNLPDSERAVRVRVRIEPAGLGFSADLISYEQSIALLALDGDLTRCKLPILKKEVEKIQGVKGITLDMSNLKSIDDTGWNYLLFTAQQRGPDFKFQLKGLNAAVAQGLKDAELDDEFIIVN
jgi:anti-anti-sigma regulatory factor